MLPSWGDEGEQPPVALNQGPSRYWPARPLLFFKLTLFCPKWSHFSLPEHTPKLTKLGIYVTPAEKCHTLLSSSISTTRWRYNQGKCILAYNSHILCCTFKNLISTCSLNCAESCDIGHAHFRRPLFSANLQNIAKYRKPTFRNPPGNFTEFPKTLHSAPWSLLAALIYIVPWCSLSPFQKLRRIHWWKNVDARCGYDEDVVNMSQTFKAAEIHCVVLQLFLIWLLYRKVRRRDMIKKGHLRITESTLPQCLLYRKTFRLFGGNEQSKSFMWLE